MQRIAFSYTRFSTLQQEQGDSERRQIESARAAEHGYVLDESIAKYSDDVLLKMIEIFPEKFRRARLEGGHEGVALVELMGASRIPLGQLPEGSVRQTTRLDSR